MRWGSADPSPKPAQLTPLLYGETALIVRRKVSIITYIIQNTTAETTLHARDTLSEICGATLGTCSC